MLTTIKNCILQLLYCNLIIELIFKCLLSRGIFFHRFLTNKCLKLMLLTDEPFSYVPSRLLFFPPNS